MLAAYFDYRTLSWINLDTQAHSEEKRRSWQLRSHQHAPPSTLPIFRSLLDDTSSATGTLFWFSDGISGCCHVYEISWRDHHGIMIAESPVDYRVRCLLDRLRGT